MRPPDTTDESTHEGIPCLVETWTDWTEFPWDGAEPLPAGAEGYDLLVRVTLEPNFFKWVGHASLGSVWILPDQAGRDYLAEELRNVTAEAKRNAFRTLLDVAAGDRLRAAQRECRAAKVLLNSRSRIAAKQNAMITEEP